MNGCNSIPNDKEKMMNCTNCKFSALRVTDRPIILCSNPKNYQPAQRQYMKLKPLSPRFFPEPPHWCKGFTPKEISYCILCEQIVNSSPHLVRYYDGFVEDYDWCEGVLASCPPPEWDTEWIEMEKEG